MVGAYHVGIEPGIVQLVRYGNTPLTKMREIYVLANCWTVAMCVVSALGVWEEMAGDFCARVMD